MSDTPTKRSFSLGRKWSIAFDVAVRTVVVLVVVAMVNYLSGRHFGRFYLSSQTRVELSPRTVSLLKSLTNDVKVILYYERDDALYSTISSLLGEYRAVNPRITIESVDYSRDAAEAQRVKNTYKLSASTSQIEKNLVIFDCEGRWKIANGDALAERTFEELPREQAGETERKFRRKLVAFNGELMFTSMLLAVMNPKPLKAYFLEGHGEHQIDSTDEVAGYMKFAAVLRQNYIMAIPLSLLGTNGIPADCNLLIVAGSKSGIPEGELKCIQQYLEQGGRLMALFNFMGKDRPSGLEKILARWGVTVGDSVVRDADNTITGSDVIVSKFSNHPVVNPLMGSRLHLILPRSISAQQRSNAAADASKVEELAFSGDRAVLVDEPARGAGAFPLIVAVEKGAVKGVITERGATRMIVAGDSFFLGNRQIDSAANRDYAGYAANWLLDRSLLLEGLGPRPVTEYRVNMTRSQMQTVEWVLLAALPGGVLLLGMLVWFARRK